MTRFSACLHAIPVSLSGMRRQPIVIKGKIKLKRFDPAFCDGLDKEKTKALTAAYGRRIGELQQLLYATSHPAAPWHVVPANRNWFRDFVVAKTVVQAMEALEMKWPKSAEDLSKVKIE